MNETKFKVGDKVIPYRVVTRQDELYRTPKSEDDKVQLGKVTTIIKACPASKTEISIPCWKTDDNGHWYEDELKPVAENEVSRS